VVRYLIHIDILILLISCRGNKIEFMLTLGFCSILERTSHNGINSWVCCWFGQHLEIPLPVL